MVRRKLTGNDKRELMEIAAYREMGKRNASLIVGWSVAKAALPWALLVLSVGALGRFLWHVVGSLSAPDVHASTPVSAGPWPWVLLALSAATAVFLWAYRWATPYRGGAKLIVAIVFCLALSALAILWVRAT